MGGNHWCARLDFCEPLSSPPIVSSRPYPLLWRLCVAALQDDFESKWSEAIQEKHIVLQEKLVIEGRLAEAESQLRDRSAKLTVTEARIAELEDNLAKTSAMLEQAAARLKQMEDEQQTPQAILSASNCVMTKHHEVVTNAFKELQTENRQLRQDIKAMSEQLAIAQDYQREAEDSRARLEHEIHRVSRLRGEAEMSRSDAEKQLREYRLAVHGSSRRGEGKHKRSQSLRKARTLGRRLVSDSVRD